jgi:hypothetical protein
MHLSLSLLSRCSHPSLPFVLITYQPVPGIEIAPAVDFVKQQNQSHVKFLDNPEDVSLYREREKITICEGYADKSMALALMSGEGKTYQSYQSYHKRQREDGEKEEKEKDKEEVEEKEKEEKEKEEDEEGVEQEKQPLGEGQTNAHKKHTCII